MSAAIVYTLLPATPFAPSPTSEADALAAAMPLLTFSDVEWDFDANDIKTPKRIIKGVDVIIQNLRIKLRTFLGTWFLNLNVGIPKDRVFGVGKDKRVIREIYLRSILTTPGIARVDDLEVTIDKATRRAEIGTFRATLGTGQALVLAPFVLLL